jgi:hypothetical protein
MPNRVQTYVIHDSDPSQRGAKRIRREDAQSWNEKGYGIFHTVQEFHGPRRIENLVHINAWAVDIDKGTKEEMLSQIGKGLVPTMLIETKSGYHVYWKARDATQENWRHIVENRLVPFYKADKKAKDLARLLRVPGFNHLKNPAEPFLIKAVHTKHVEYSEREMLHFYKDLLTQAKQKKLHNKTIKEFPQDGSFWERVWSLDCEYALSKLSGTEYVGGEYYDFKPNSSGTKNIYVNGKSTSCWIDHEGRIGSLDDGGPTIAQWLNWFHKDYSKTVSIIKEVFPECQAERQMKLI